jgi:hypothetical protein
MQPHRLLLLILEEAHAWIQDGYRSLAPLLVRLSSISNSKKEYFILVIEILYSILISSALVLPLSHTL